MLYIEEAGMAFRPYSKMFYMCTCHGINNSNENTVHLFYYITVLLGDDTLEEDPNLYKGLILNSF